MGRITPLSELPLSDDFMFGAVMSREPIAKLFLEALLGIEIDKVIYIGAQDTIEGEYYAHGVRLDVCLKDDKGTIYNIEMQVANNKDLEYRIRYYQGKIDRETLNKGVLYKDLPGSYIVFVCDFDYFGRGLAVYERKSVIKGCEDVSYDDGSHVFILNSRYKEKNAGVPIIEFLDFVRRNDSSAAYQSELAKSVVTLVSDVRRDKDKEAFYMTYVQKMEDVRRAGREEGFEAGKEEGREEGREKGKEEGREEGIQIGIKVMISVMKSLGHSKEFMLETLVREYSMSREEARQTLDKYW